ILKKKDVEKALSEIYSFKNSLNIYCRLIETIENESFKEEFNINIQNALVKAVKASDEIRELKMIGEMLFDRMNAFYWIFNAFLMWDFALLARLEKWKIKNRDRIGAWLYALGEMEAYCALSNVHFDKAEWVLPEITGEEEIEAKEFTHPLIVPEGVKNSFFLGGEIRTSLITGSNMSGKSTFLRTTGLNMVFSYLGLPVNAEAFKTGRMVPYTCMRTKDSLEEGISSFYAEILRVKNIIKATERGERVFFLLDEIFKGTNSADRHTGAEMLIKQLMDRSSRGLVSTHDLELCELEKTDSRINNLHFKEYYTNNEIKFDYKLRKGKSTTRNAVYLMKMAGINLE
ncbi:MAG: DNA mismatch repair protein MutS, partial [Clostridiaceae bacterium]